MKLPLSLRIGFRPIVLKYVAPPSESNDAGYYSDSLREMFIAADTPEHEQGLALLHELVHVAVAERDLNLADEVEEAVCDAVSRTFAELLTRNPGVIGEIEKALRD